MCAGSWMKDRLKHFSFMLKVISYADFSKDGVTIK